MGNNNSSNQSESKGENQKPISFYAEIITDKTLPTDIPPIKVLIHEQIVSTATDSIRDSEIVVNQLSKSLILEFLNNPSSPEKLGTLLRYVLGYEYLLQPTRELIYWSLKNSYTKRYIDNFSHSTTLKWIDSNGANSIKLALIPWLNISSYSSLATLTRWSLRQHDMVIMPFTEIAVQSLPYAKVILLYNFAQG